MGLRLGHHLLGGVSMLVLGMVAKDARGFTLPCTPDDALSETAAEFLLSGAPVRAETLLPAARRKGFDGVALQAHEGLEDAGLIAWLKAQGDRADAPLACGEASSEARRLVLVSAQGGHLKRSGNKLYGRLAPGFSAPHLVLEDADGNTERMALRAAELQTGVVLPEKRALRRAQLVAEGPSGPRPVAEVVFSEETLRSDAVWSAPEPAEPREPAPERSRDSLFGRLLAFRRQEGARSVRPNQLLGASAQKHAVRVCELGRVAHRIGRGDDPETRLREEHIEARAVGEAVARAGSADAALQAIFDSPSHRMALTDRAFTDAGIGQASDAKGHTCVVVLLASWPRRLP